MSNNSKCCWTPHSGSSLLSLPPPTSRWRVRFPGATPKSVLDDFKVSSPNTDKGRPVLKWKRHRFSGFIIQNKNNSLVHFLFKTCWASYPKVNSDSFFIESFHSLQGMARLPCYLHVGPNFPRKQRRGSISGGNRVIVAATESSCVFPPLGGEFLRAGPEMRTPSPTVPTTLWWRVRAWGPSSVFIKGEKKRLKRLGPRVQLLRSLIWDPKQTELKIHV